MESLLELLEQIKHTHIHINLSLPFSNHWLVKCILFPVLTSCQFVILFPGHIKFHQVWVYWLHREVYVVTEISLHGQRYGQGIRRAQQLHDVGIAEMLGCLEPSPRKSKLALCSSEWVQQDTPEGQEPGRDCELSSSHSTHPLASLPLQPSPHSPPPGPKILPEQWRWDWEAWG
jgi:hypothetical protein